MDIWVGATAVSVIVIMRKPLCPTFEANPWKMLASHRALGSIDPNVLGLDLVLYNTILQNTCSWAFLEDNVSQYTSGCGCVWGGVTLSQLFLYFLSIFQTLVFKTIIFIFNAFAFNFKIRLYYHFIHKLLPNFNRIWDLNKLLNYC